MINTKKRTTAFLGDVDSVESAVRANHVNFNKRVLKITHTDMPELDFEAIDGDDMHNIAVDHLIEVGVEFKDISGGQTTVRETPVEKHTNKVLEKQEAIVQMFDDGWLDCRLIAKILKVR